MRKTLTLLLCILLLCACLLPAYAAEDGAALPAEPAEPVPALDFKVEAMLAWALETAADDTHGYSQRSRFGPNYDCTSFVCTALKKGGFPVGSLQSTSGLLHDAERLGFAVYEKGEAEPQRGDILIRRGVHAEICMGNGACVAAHQDYDWRSGDSTGREIEYRTADDSFGCPFCKYRQYNFILRYEGLEQPVFPEIETEKKTVS